MFGDSCPLAGERSTERKSLYAASHNTLFLAIIPISSFTLWPTVYDLPNQWSFILKICTCSLSVVLKFIWSTSLRQTWVPDQHKTSSWNSLTIHHTTHTELIMWLDQMNDVNLYFARTCLLSAQVHIPKTFHVVSQERLTFSLLLTYRVRNILRSRWRHVDMLPVFVLSFLTHPAGHHLPTKGQLRRRRGLCWSACNSPAQLVGLNLSARILLARVPWIFGTCRQPGPGEDEAGGRLFGVMPVFHLHAPPAPVSTREGLAPNTPFTCNNSGSLSTD